jgi:hypothetical protein
MNKFLCCFLAVVLPAAALPAKTVTIPFGTTIYCELDQAVTTRQKEAHAVQVGDIVRAHVWKDVWVDGHVVIAAGSPVFAKVDRMKKARMAGQKGYLVLEVLNAQAVDRNDVPIDGGYDRSGKGRMGVTIGLSVALAWPFVFLKGKNVFLEPGTIFDAVVRASTEVEVPDVAPAIPEEVPQTFSVEVDYDELDPERKIKVLPLIIQVAEEDLGQARIVSVNGGKIAPVQVNLLGDDADADRYKAHVNFKQLSKHFSRGMNRFEVEVGEQRAEVVLEIEF